MQYGLALSHCTGLRGIISILVQGVSVSRFPQVKHIDPVRGAFVEAIVALTVLALVVCSRLAAVLDVVDSCPLVPVVMEEREVPDGRVGGVADASGDTLEKTIVDE